MSMLMVTVYKAGAVRPEAPTGDLTIRAVAEVPALETLDGQRALYDREGEHIADALVAHLPGGTVDAVLRHLLLQRASLLRVRMDV